MGQQQLLLIILGVVIVGVAIVVGLTMFRDNAVTQNRDAMANDLMHIAAKAKHYYKRPRSIGGGGHSFEGLSGTTGMAILVTVNFSDNSNGTYTIKEDGDANRVVFRGVGKTAMDDGTGPILECSVTPTSQNITIIK